MPNILVVLGCTGVGKTKLSIALAKAFNAEVISCDSIQVYSGLPIASNQVTLKESEGIRHHCVSVVPPWRMMQVHGFRRVAKPLIKEIHQRGKNVVIAGGTFYWLESLLYQTFMNMDEEDECETTMRSRSPSSSANATNTASASSLLSEDVEMKAASESTSAPSHAEEDSAVAQFYQQLMTPNATSEDWKAQLRSINTLSTSQRIEVLRKILLVVNDESTPHSISPLHLFEFLCVIDSASASRLHPNNDRKVKRSLEVYVQEGGRTQSELIAATGGAKGLGGLSYRTLAIWLDCEQSVLDQRLDARIDEMMQRGLLKEVEDMYQLLWHRQHHPPTHDDWKYSSPLDPDCALCSKVESQQLKDFGLASSSLTASTTTSTPATISHDSSSFYLGPDELKFDWERGTGQALGFKEFLPYFRLKFHTTPDDIKAQIPPPKKKQKNSSTTADSSSSSNESLYSSSVFTQCIATCIASLKARTRTYSRVQTRWIRTRLWSEPTSSPATAITEASSTSSAAAAASSSASTSPNLPMLRLDATRIDAESWSRDISSPALEAASLFLSTSQPIDLSPYTKFSSKLPPVQPRKNTNETVTVTSTAPSSVDSLSSHSDPSALWQKYTCPDCDNQLCLGLVEWQKHLASKRHRSRMTRDDRRAKQEQQRETIQKQREEKRRAKEAVANINTPASTTTPTASSATTNSTP